MDTHDTIINSILDSYDQSKKNLEMYSEALKNESRKILREQGGWGFFTSPTNYRLLGWSQNSTEIPNGYIKTPSGIPIEISRYEGMGNTSRGIILEPDKITLAINQYVPYHTHMREAALNGLLRMLRGIKEIVDNGITVELKFGEEQIVWHKDDATIPHRVESYIRTQWDERNNR